MWSLHVEWGGARRWFSLLLVVASCSDNEIVVVKYGILGAIVTLAFGHQLMMLIFIFNINSFQALPHFLFCIITYTTLQFDQVGWYFLVMAIAYLSRSPDPTTLKFISQVWLALSKDKLARIKSSMLYVKPNVRLSRARDNDCSFKLGCDCVVLFISQGVVEGVKIRGGKASRPKH